MLYGYCWCDGCLTAYAWFGVGVVIGFSVLLVNSVVLLCFVCAYFVFGLRFSVWLYACYDSGVFVGFGFVWMFCLGWIADIIGICCREFVRLLVLHRFCCVVGWLRLVVLCLLLWIVLRCGLRVVVCKVFVYCYVLGGVVW